MRELPQWEFSVYALSLPRGHGFGNRPPVSVWRSDDGLGCGAITKDININDFGFLVMRRRVDQVWTVIAQSHGLSSKSEAFEQLAVALKEGQPPEPMPLSTLMRPALYDLKGRTPSDIFKLLTRPSHIPAAWILNQLYLALPKPDRNWASDCQTSNFHTRLWEAQLLASFREQGLIVTQPFESPDFRIQNKLGEEAWVEAVTANPTLRYNHVNAPRSVGPTDPDDIFFGKAALRFAKTIGSKLQRQYDQLAHVTGKPFMLAIADFQASASMLWSRESLIGYLYGEGARQEEVEGQLQAVPMKATYLLDSSTFPAGLFADDRHSEISAIIFSNACSMAKLNRVAVSGRGAPEGLRYTRLGQFFDRTPGALKGIPFCFDVASKEYRGLWPHGFEPWCAELEVFHNSFARCPVSFELLPEATHWFDQNGEKVCNSVYETSILWSQTHIQNADDPPPRLEDIVI